MELIQVSDESPSDMWTQVVGQYESRWLKTNKKKIHWNERTPVSNSHTGKAQIKPNNTECWNKLELCSLLSGPSICPPPAPNTLYETVRGIWMFQMNQLGHEGEDK